VANHSTCITSRRLEALSAFTDFSLPNIHPKYSNPVSDSFPPDDVSVITKKRGFRLETPSYLRVFMFFRIYFVSILYLSLPMDQDRLSEFVFSALLI
jgi:hypothetical protein